MSGPGFQPDYSDKIKAEIKKIPDVNLLEMMIASAMQRRVLGKDMEGIPPDMLEHMEAALGRCVANLKRVPALIDDLANAREQLAIERSSATKAKARVTVLQAIVDQGKMLLPGQPEHYPVAIMPFVVAIHENATKAVGP